VLQEREFEPVGSSKTHKVDVRIIAATNRDLAEEVRAGRFRSDLFFRLNVVPLAVPPLRERPDDIPLLVAYFVARFARQFGRRIDSVSRTAMERLRSYAWPGNIRELQNIIERAVVLSSGPVLTIESDVFTLPETTSPQPQPAAAAVQSGAAQPTFVSLDEAERHHIAAVLMQTRGVIEGPAGAARILDLHPNTLRSRIKKLGLTGVGRTAS
jgi:formate hydrogenlyase transcriptional activator